MASSPATPAMMLQLSSSSPLADRYVQKVSYFSTFQDLIQIMIVCSLSLCLVAVCTVLGCF
jgi:hypothetical protein